MRLLRRALALASCGVLFLLAAVGGPTAASATGSSACGGHPTLPKPGGGTWRCSFDDEFNGTALNTRIWTPQLTATSGFHSGPECYVNSPATISVSGGSLHLTVRRTSAPFTCGSPAHSFRAQVIAGSVSTYDKFAQTYGRFEVRAKFPAETVKGLQESIWLWPADPTRYGPVWPMSGEIDIAEAYSNYAGHVVPYVHYVPMINDASVTNRYCAVQNPSAFHTYAVVWQPGTISISIDGASCVVDHYHPMLPAMRPAPFNAPFMIALTQSLGTGRNAYSPSQTQLPATTQIDYVRVWK